MARKTYTETDRSRIRQALLDTGLEIAASRGIASLHLAELVAAVGISKPYFYTFFSSLEELLLQIMEEQRKHLIALLQQELSSPEGTWEERVERFFHRILRHREHGILVMTQREELELHRRLHPERFDDFRPGQRDFFCRFLELMEIPESACPPEVLANLVFSCVLVHNSAAQSMPFLFPEYLDEAAALQVRFMVHYLSDIRVPREGR